MLPSVPAVAPVLPVALGSPRAPHASPRASLCDGSLSDVVVANVVPDIGVATDAPSDVIVADVVPDIPDIPDIPVDVPDTGIQQEADPYDSGGGDDSEEDLDHYTTAELRLFSRIGVSSYQEITEEVLRRAPPDCVACLRNTLRLAQERYPNITGFIDFMPRSEVLASPRGTRLRDDTGRSVGRVVYDDASGDDLILNLSTLSLHDDKDEDKDEEHTCGICDEDIVLDDNEWHDCDKCGTRCCTECYEYRPDLFGMSDDEDENGFAFNNCDVCVKCDEKYPRE